MDNFIFSDLYAEYVKKFKKDENGDWVREAIAVDQDIISNCLDKKSCYDDEDYEKFCKLISENESARKVILELYKYYRFSLEKSWAEYQIVATKLKAIKRGKLEKA